MTKIQNGRCLFEKKVYIWTKNGKPILKNIPTSLKVTIKSFNIDSYVISAKDEMYKKALSLYFIPSHLNIKT